MGVSTELLIARRKREAEAREATAKVSTKKKVEPVKDSEDE